MSAFRVPRVGGLVVVGMFFTGLASAPSLGADGTTLTGLTFFGADDRGLVNEAYRWNTFYLDAAWDIAVWEGTIPLGTPVWINDPTNLGVSLPLVGGETRTFSFCVSGVPPGYFGMNFFFDGLEAPSPGVPGISVVSYSDEDGPDVGVPFDFAPIDGAITTMGWPVASVGGAGTLVYRNEATGTTVTLDDFVVYAPSAHGLDLVQAQEPGGRILTDATDGTADLVGQFTLIVESSGSPPSGLICVRSQDGRTVDLSWSNEGVYDAIRIARDGTVIATLAANATDYRDSAAPIGMHTYRVVAVKAGEEFGPSCELADPAHPEVHLSAMTFFGANADGLVNPGYRWNTLYLDGAWDIAIYEGEPPPEDPVPWLNDLAGNLGVDVPLRVGEERTFSFVVSNVPEGYYGLNIFFDGSQDPSPGTPGISVVAYTDVDGPGTGDDPAWKAIAGTTNTMGWAIADVGGSGSLSYLDTEKGVQVTLRKFAVYTPEVFGVDVVQPQEPGGLRLTDAGDGVWDLIATFTLEVSPYVRPPMDLVCTRSADGRTADLSWSVLDAYDSIRILRDGVEVASLPGDATGWTDTAVPAYTHAWQVAAAVGADRMGPEPCELRDPANPEIFLTALALFGATEAGAVRIAERWNTYYLDPAWDIGLHEGPVIQDSAEYDPADESFWLNERDGLSIRIPFRAGEERTFSFYCPRSAVGPNWFGANFFFDGAEEPSPGLPGISVLSYTNEDGPGDPPAFQANAAKNTMGWPLAFVSGSGQLIYEDCALGLKVTLTDFVVYEPSGLGGGFGIDVAQAQEPGSVRVLDGQDGLPDFAGEFTVRVESRDCNPPPADLVCTRSGDGTSTDLSWSVLGVYDSLTVHRDGIQIANLAVDATSYTDTAVPIGTRTYSVLCDAGGRRGGPSCTVADPAHPEVFVTALTLYGATDQGIVRPEERWNTLYLDAAWDLGLHEGPVLLDSSEYDPQDPTFWMNGADDMSIQVPLMAGEERSFSFYTGRIESDADWFGLNLFFGGGEAPAPGTAGISVFAFADEDGPESGDAPSFQANAAAVTMGWPIADIPGAGTLVFEDAERGLRVTLTDFVIYPQSALGGGFGIDLVQTQEPGSRIGIADVDGVPDFAGQFTLSVESFSLASRFHRGDANADGQLNITDGIFVLNYLFLGGPTPACLEAANANDDASINITDGIYILNYLFLGGPAPTDPGPTDSPCGGDPVGSPSSLGCEAYLEC